MVINGLEWLKTVMAMAKNGKWQSLFFKVTIYHFAPFCAIF